ncbi:MAG: cysteine desulfurase family protein [Vulcanimicrobiaceae bacterium]
MIEPRIYADYAATTPVRPEAIEVMLPYFGEGGYNASSVHAEGRKARAALDAARETIAGCLGARPREIVATAGGSESDNIAIFGVARARVADGRHVITTAIEHHAVLHAVDALEHQGWEVTRLPVDDDGVVTPAAFAAALREDTVLASIMLANNEVGTIQPIAELARAARARGVTFHTDAVQAAAVLKLHVDELGVDLLTLSAHKYYGPQGVGLLYVREGPPLAPLIVGGAQEFAKRAGTENVAGVAGLAKALQLAGAERAQEAPRIAALRDHFERTIAERVGDVAINGAGAARVPHISNLSFGGIPSDSMVMRLDLAGAAVSAGSACAAGSVEPSHVIAALRLAPRWAGSAVRFSFGRATTEHTIERLIALVQSTAADLRRISAGPMH